MVLVAPPAGRLHVATRVEHEDAVPVSAQHFERLLLQPLGRLTVLAVVGRFVHLVRRALPVCAEPARAPVRPPRDARAVPVLLALLAVVVPRVPLAGAADVEPRVSVVAQHVKRDVHGPRDVVRAVGVGEGPPDAAVLQHQVLPPVDGVPVGRAVLVWGGRVVRVVVRVLEVATPGVPISALRVGFRASWGFRHDAPRDPPGTTETRARGPRTGVRQTGRPDSVEDPDGRGRPPMGETSKPPPKTGGPGRGAGLRRLGTRPVARRRLVSRRPSTSIPLLPRTPHRLPRPGEGRAVGGGRGGRQQDQRRLA